MFTGLVEGTGEVVALERGAGRVRLWIQPGPFRAAELALGDSVAIDGVCLTAVEPAGGPSGGFAVDAGAETLARTAIGELEVGRRVNLERALRVGDRLGGHLVQGHVDGVARLERRHPDGEANLVLALRLPAASARYVVEKGSLTLDGVSLTVNRVTDDLVEVALIPATVAATTLGDKREGARLNVEVDLIARYVERLVAGYRAAPEAHP